MKAPRLPCCFCGTLVLETSTTCAFCAVPLRLTEAGFVVREPAPIETVAEVNSRIRAVVEARA